MRIPEIEVRLGVQLASTVYANHSDFTSRVAKIRKKYAEQYGFVVPEIQISDSFDIGPQSYQIRIHDVTLAEFTVQLGSVLVVHKNGSAPDYPGETVKDPAYGLPASWVSAVFTNELRSDGFLPVDVSSVVLTHLSSVITTHLAQLLSYRSIRSLLGDLELDYRKLLDDISPTHITYTGIQAVLKLLLSERVSIRNLPLIIEAIAEISPHTRRAEHVAAHVRSRLSQQICADLSVHGTLNVFRIGTRWDLAFQQALKRDSKGEIIEFDFDPRQLEAFGKELSEALRERVEAGEPFVILCMADSRSMCGWSWSDFSIGLCSLARRTVSKCQNQRSWQLALTEGFTDALLTPILAFCRVGVCLMIAPGFGLARIPSLIRLYISLAVSLGVPVDSELSLSQSGSIATAALVAKEVLIGIVLGLSVRLLLLALETTAEFISHCIGLSNNFGAAVEGHELLYH